MPKLKYKNILIFGPQASGKGTQAEIIEEKFKIPHISTGDIFRREIKKDTEIGRLAEKTINKGQLMPDKITNEIVKEQLERKESGRGFILDGYPRNLIQAKFLESITDIDLALEVWISDKEAVTRISGRRSCINCGAAYHLKYNPPKIAGICNKCKSELVIRKDEDEETVRKRLAIYHQTTEPILKHYRKKGVYKKIDGMLLIKEVERQIMRILNEQQ